MLKLYYCKASNYLFIIFVHITTESFTYDKWNDTRLVFVVKFWIIWNTLTDWASLSRNNISKKQTQLKSFPCLLTSALCDKNVLHVIVENIIKSIVQKILKSYYCNASNHLFALVLYNAMKYFAFNESTIQSCIANMLNILLLSRITVNW